MNMIKQSTLTNIIRASVEDNDRVLAQGRCTKEEHLSAKEFAQELVANLAAALRVDDEVLAKECGL